MLRFNLFFAATIVVILSFTACHRAQRHLESGDYDAAIDHCVDKLEGRKNKSDELVRGLELAFQKATDRDMRAADALVTENRPENWEKVYNLHRQIQFRQDKVNPLLPLESKKGYKAKFLFVNIEKLMAESRAKAAQYLYDSANEDLKRARTGSKPAAREAFTTLSDLQRKYFQDYKDVETLKSEVLELGRVYVLFDIRNETNRVLPRHFNERILAISKADLDTQWKIFHFNAEKGYTYDYKAVLRLDNVDISPERIHERSYTDQCDIQDGWEYVYDAKGNVKKDSLGNDIRHARMVMARADVVEVFQSKAARIAGSVDIYNAKGTQRLDTRPMATEIRFEHYASTFRGDERALTHQSKCRIGNSPAAFPHDDDMLAQAADKMKPTLSYELASSPVLR